MMSEVTAERNVLVEANESQAHNSALLFKAVTHCYSNDPSESHLLARALG